MFHLTDFCNWLNNEVGGNGPLPDLLHDDYGTALAGSLHKHFAEDRERGGLRMSSIGKPATLLALAKLGYSEPEPRGKSRIIFHIGDVFENLLEVLMQSYGIEILESQTELSLFGLTGHLDYVIRSPITGEPVVVEAKTMNSNYTRKWKKTQDNDRGYVTQLAMYTTARDLPGTWVCFNKDTAETFEVMANPGMLQAALLKAEDVINRLDKVQTLDDILHTSGGYFRPPPPQEEKFNHVYTGKYFPPTTFKMSPFKHVFYNTEYALNGYKKRTEYVTGYKTSTEMKAELQHLVESGEVLYNG